MTHSSSRVPESRLLSVLDATFLHDDARIEDLHTFAARCKGQGFAALCVETRWVPSIRTILGEDPTTITALVNFPDGENGPWELGEEAAILHQYGVTDIDVVVPTDSLHRDGGDTVRWSIEAIREAAPGCSIKAVLSAAQLDPSALRKAAAAAISAGADFIQAGTGLPDDPYTPTNTAALLEVMKAYPGKVGIKVAGLGLDIDAASAAWLHTEQALGAQWCHRKRFRIAADTNLLNAISPL